VNHRLVIGVTGGIATGKSTVLQILAERGFATIDADLVYRELIKTNGHLVGAIADAFGPGVVGADGAIDRMALGAMVFAEAAALQRLEAIAHPVVVTEVRRLLQAAQTERIAVDAVKLIESGMDALCDQVWLVECDPTVQLARLMVRNNLSPADAQQRIAAGPDLVRAQTRADVILDNSGDRTALVLQIDEALGAQ